MEFFKYRYTTDVRDAILSLSLACFSFAKKNWDDIDLESNSSNRSELLKTIPLMVFFGIVGSAFIPICLACTVITAICETIVDALFKPFVSCCLS